MYNKINSFGFEVFIGEKGSGKTLSITALTHEDLKTTQAKVNIFSNYNLTDEFFKGLAINKRDNFFKFSVDDIDLMYKENLLYKNSIFLIDEMHILLDSRSFMKKKNKHFGYFAGQIRKRGNVLRGTTHDKGMYDIRGRIYTDVEIYCYKGLIEDNKFFIIDNYNIELNIEQLDKLYIRCDYYLKKLVHSKNFEPEFIYSNIRTVFIPAKKYFNMYDTEEFIEF